MQPDSATYACPVCRRSIHYHAVSCSYCEADVRAIGEVSEFPDVCYNAAVAAARDERWEDAVQHLAVALHYRNDDAEALLLLGKVLAKLDRADAARAQLMKANAVAPRDERIKTALEACGGQAFDPGLLGIG